MKYRILGRTGMKVSEIGFGAWGIGGRTAGLTSYGDTNDQVSLSALQRALEVGINFFDTSSVYGDGHSEDLLGQAFGRRRDNVVLATKAGFITWEQKSDFSPSFINSSLETSLRRLKTDYIDLLQLHNPPPDLLRNEKISASLEDLIRQGKIRGWGVSVKSPVDALSMLEYIDIPVIQTNFNMLDVRAIESGLFKVAEKKQIGIIGRTPLCFGFLSGAIQADAIFPPGDHRNGWPRAQIQRWIEGAGEALAVASPIPGESNTQTALRFCLSFDAVSSVIPGMLTVAEVEENAKASDYGRLSISRVDAVLALNRRHNFFSHS